MTEAQITILINSLLQYSSKQVAHCRTHQENEFARDSWIACMVAATVLGDLAGALIDVKEHMIMEKNRAQEEKTTLKL